MAEQHTGKTHRHTCTFMLIMTAYFLCSTQMLAEAMPDGKLSPSWYQSDYMFSNQKEASKTYMSRLVHVLLNY